MAKSPNRVDRAIRYSSVLSLPSQYIVAIANIGNLIQTNASPKEYSGILDRAPDNNITNQNAKHALTQKAFKKEKSRRIKHLIKNTKAVTLSQRSAGLLSINRIKGPKSQKTKNGFSQRGNIAKADLPSDMILVYQLAILSWCVSLIFYSAIYFKLKTSVFSENRSM